MNTIEMLDDLIEETKQKMRTLKIRMGILHNKQGLEEARTLLDKHSERLALFEYLKGCEARYEEMSKAFEKKSEPSDQDGLNPNQVFIDDWLTAENIETRRQEDGI